MLDPASWGGRRTRCAIEHGHHHSPEGTISLGATAASPGRGNDFAVYAVRRLSCEWPFDRMKLLVYRMGECALCAGENGRFCEERCGQRDIRQSGVGVIGRSFHGG